MEIYTIITESIYDYDADAMRIQPFISETEARECFDKLVAEARKDASSHGWCVEDDDEYCFSAGEEGYYAQSHVSVSLNKSDVPVHSWELQTDVESLAIDEIRSLLAKTPNKEWHFGHDYCDVDGGGDIPFVNAHNVMQDDTICEIGIDAIAIDDKNNITILYHLANTEEIGGDQFEDNFITCVMPQDYQEVAHELWNATSKLCYTDTQYQEALDALQASVDRGEIGPDDDIEENLYELAEFIDGCNDENYAAYYQALRAAWKEVEF